MGQLFLVVFAAFSPAMQKEQDRVFFGVIKIFRKKHPVADAVHFFNKNAFLVFFQILGFAAESVKQQNQWDDHFEPVHAANLENFM